MSLANMMFITFITYNSLSKTIDSIASSRCSSVMSGHVITKGDFITHAPSVMTWASVMTFVFITQSPFRRVHSTPIIGDDFDLATCRQFSRYILALLRRCPVAHLPR